MSDTKKIVSHLRKRYGQWGWLGQRAHDACCIHSILPFDFIISCDAGKEREQFFRGRSFSVEKASHVRKDWSNEDIKTSLQGDLGKDFLQYLKDVGNKVNLLCYRSVAQIENLGSEVGANVKIYAVPEELKTKFDDKIFFYNNLPGLGLDRIDGVVSTAGEHDFDKIKEMYGLPFVLQYPFGSSGNFTFIVKQRGLFEQLKDKYPSDPVIVRKYVDGYSLNVNGLIIRQNGQAKVFCTSPSIQLTGMPECSSFPSAFCGNDYTAAMDLEKKIVEQVENYIIKVGGWMSEHGFLGVFGMDFVVGGDKVYPVEINPRFQNSTSLFTCCCERIEHSGVAIALLHIAAFLPDDDVMKKFVDDFYYEDLMGSVSGSQIILHNKEESDVLVGEIKPGVYAVNEGNLEFVREGVSINSCRSKEEYLVTCGVPYVKTVVKPNAPICKVQTLNNLVDRRGKRELTDESKKVIRMVYDMLDLRVPEGVIPVNTGI